MDTVGARKRFTQGAAIGSPGFTMKNGRVAQGANKQNGCRRSLTTLPKRVEKTRINESEEKRLLVR